VRRAKTPLNRPVAKYVPLLINGIYKKYQNSDENYHRFESQFVDILANGRWLTVPNLTYQDPNILHKKVLVQVEGRKFIIDNLDKEFNGAKSKFIKIMMNGKMVPIVNIAYDGISEEDQVDINGTIYNCKAMKGMPEISHTSANPVIAYINLQIKADQDSDSIHVKALHDSGCAKTIMNYKTYSRLAQIADVEIHPIKEVSISSCTGEKTVPLGFISIYLTFEGENGQSITVPHQVLVHDKIEHDLLLGRDFTGSKYKLLETNHHLYFTDKIEHSDLEELWRERDSTLVNVPIFNETSVQFKKLLTNTETIIPPFTTAIVSCTINELDLDLALANKKQRKLFEIDSIFHFPLKTFNALLSIENVNDIPVPIYNPSAEDIILASNKHLADVIIEDDIEQIYNLQVSTSNDNSTNLHCHQLEISTDEGLSEEEKEQMFLEYLETGHYTPSMTGYIANAPSVTEMSLKKIKPWTEAEFEKQFQLDHLSHSLKGRVLEILKRHKTIFSRHEMDIGLASNIEMEIEVDNSKPRIQKYYPLPIHVREQTKEILDQMIEYGLLRECNEPSNFLANLLVTKKKDGKIRVLLDGRLLNQATIRKATIMTAPLEIFTTLSQKKYLTLVDVSNAFWHIPIKYEHQPYTAFYSEAHGKRLCYTRAPQGLKNSPVYLHFLMCEMFAPFVRSVMHYADDLMIATQHSVEHHLDILDQVLQRFETFNIKLKASKLEILKEQVEFLGIVWKKGTLNIPEARVKGFKNLAPPNTPKKVKSFVCAMSYYRKFIPRFAELSKPLLDLSLVHPKQFKWEPEHQKAFDNLILAIQQHTSLNLPNHNLPFYVQTDASDVAGAGRIYQMDEHDNEKLIACVSRTFTRAERKYGVFRKEVLALLYTLKSMDFFLRFAPKLIIKVDAKSILFLRLCKDSAGILLRFSVELAKYETEIHHVPGVKNEISDMLSRQHKDIQNILDENRELSILSEKDSEKLLGRLLLPEGTVFSPKEIATLLELPSLPSPSAKKRKTESKAKTGRRNIKITPQTLGERKIKVPPTTLRRRGILLPNMACTIKNCSERDKGNNCIHNTINYNDFSDLSKFIAPGQISKDHFADLQAKDIRFKNIYKNVERHRDYIKIDKILFRKTSSRMRPVLPTVLLESVIYSKHYTVLGLHLSKTRIKRDIEYRYFVDSSEFKKLLDSICDPCIQCQFNNSRLDPHTFKMTNFAIAPRTSWAVDIIPSMSNSVNGYTSIFLAIDMFTGYVQLKALKSRKTEELIDAIRSLIIIPFGTPKLIRSDNETGMQNSAEFKQFVDNLQIDFIPCSTASPWSNGAAERAIQTIKKSVRTFLQMENEVDKWDEYLHYFVQSHNKSTNVNGYTPEELHFGFTNPSNSEFIEVWPKLTSHDEYMSYIVDKAKSNRDKALNRATENKNKTVTYRNLKRRQKTFSKGQIVLHRQLQVSTGTGGALKPLFTGPYVIEEIEEDQCSAVLEHLHTKRQIHAHFSNMQIFNYDPKTARIPTNFDSFLHEDKDSFDNLHPWVKDKRRRLNLEQEQKLKLINEKFNQLYAFTDTHTDKRQETVPTPTPPPPPPPSPSPSDPPDITHTRACARTITPPTVMMTRSRTKRLKDGTADEQNEINDSKD